LIVKNHLQSLLFDRLEAVCRVLIPQGHKVGNSWRDGSLDINRRTGMWGDWDGSTDRMSRNLVDLWIYLTGTDFKTAITEIQAWLGVSESSPESAPMPHSKDWVQPERKLILPHCEKPSVPELRQLSEVRSIGVEALAISVDRWFLRTCKYEGKRAWLLTDTA
jgi:hypothetical protein